MLNKRLRTAQVLAFIAQLKPRMIAIEACGGAYYWYCELERLGHTTKIISPQFVKPFGKRQKNDRNDAEAIAIALQQPTMRFVPPRSEEQQDMQSLHRARQRLVNHRTATVCQIRGLLLERGITIGSSITRLRRMVPEILEDADNGLSISLRTSVNELYSLISDLDQRIQYFGREIQAVFRGSEPCQRIAAIAGVGPKTATAIVAAAGDGAAPKLTPDRCAQPILEHSRTCKQGALHRCSRSRRKSHIPDKRPSPGGRLRLPSVL